MEISEADKRLRAAARAVFNAFCGSGKSLCAAESCTGGLVASSLVSIAGASGFFRGSAVCYCDAAKISALGVSPLTISEHFAESRQCAEEMARGALALYGADASVAATGFLDGNVGEKPAELAGAVFLCSAVRSGRGVETFCARLSLDPSADRNFNRAAAAACALESLKLSACASLFRRP